MERCVQDPDSALTPAVTNKMRYDRSTLCATSYVNAELVMGWVHPWVGLGWVKSFFKYFFGRLVGLGGDLTV